MIGAGIGGYMSALKGSYVYIVIGIASGELVGLLVGLVTQGRVNLPKLVSFRAGFHRVAAFASVLMALAGVAAFVLTRDWMAIAGAAFFAGCAVVYLWMRE
jgi:hypothetical protein